MLAHRRRAAGQQQRGLVAPGGQAFQAVRLGAMAFFHHGQHHRGAPLGLGGVVALHRPGRQAVLQCGAQRRVERHRDGFSRP
jgi:hypothetical protein